MNNEIQYSGFSAVPSDYECPDGALAAAVNLVPEDGALQPILPPKVKLKLPGNCTVAFIHKTSYYCHYIIKQTTTVQSENVYTLYWIDSTATEVPLDEYGNIQEQYKIDVYERPITHLNAVGNTLLVFTDEAINYVLWKNNSYNVLGDHLPDISISFGLIGHPRLWSATKEDEDDEDAKMRGRFSIYFNSIGRDDIHETWSDENKTKITSQVMAKLNKFIAEQTVNKGRFCFPFFVRWAYRLYDGSHTMQSAPILMTPSTTPAPVVLWPDPENNSSYSAAELDIMMVAADIDYEIMSDSEFSKLSKWEDIITAIDIYISKPIYTYDQSDEFTSFADDDNWDCVFTGRLYNGEKDKGEPDTKLAEEITEDRMLAPMTSTDFMTEYSEYDYGEIYAMYFSQKRYVPNYTLHAPEFSSEKRDENIENTMNFYKLATLEFSELKAEGKRTVIPVEDDYLQSLTARETLDDDYLHHDRLIAASSYGYNNRLNLSGVKRELFNGFYSNALFPFCSCLHNFELTSYGEKYINVKITPMNSGAYSEAQGHISMSVYVRENGDTYKVQNTAPGFVPLMRCFTYPETFSKQRKLYYHLLPPSFTSDSAVLKTTAYKFRDTEHSNKATKTEAWYSFSSSEKKERQVVTEDCYMPNSWGSWIFYPNANAYKVEIKDSTFAQYNYVAELKAHDFLNGAYAFLGFASERKGSYDSPSAPTQSTPIVSVPNKVYTSEVNNPFYFPLLGINTVGSGEILGMCSANKALSQGQFGQFPLYAFTTEGVWALEVATDGSYSARQPITRDVCINAQGITQLDSAVLFPTDRGLMIISGSETTCISNDLNSQHPFDLTTLPKFSKLHSLIGHTDSTCFPTLPFTDFLKKSQAVYDYTHQHIIVYAPRVTYAYVYSLKSKQWGMMFSDIASHLNSYPDTLVVDSNGYIRDFAASDDTSAKCLFVTRPLKFGAANNLKTISSAVQRGLFRKGHVGTALYGSRDLFSWYLVWSSQDHFLQGFSGTPYKYFRLAGVATLDDKENIFGASIEFNLRQTNKPR